MKIIEIEGIGPKLAEKFKEVNVGTVEKLLERGASKKGRQELAAATGIDEKLILKFVNHADLMRIKGIGPEYSELLEAAGVDSVAELSHRRADNLHVKMVETNQEKKIVRQLPSQSQVEGWIEQAKKLPVAVTH
jgi:predicted flap endonuclease-1-like 5' DNA nuclease